MSEPVNAPASAVERHLTVPDLAARCGVTVRTVYEWNKHGTGPAYFKPGGVGSRCRYRLADVLAWESERLAAQRRVA
jgi:predicted DNA-binding transcriptional regulator AlpA